MTVHVNMFSLGSSEIQFGYVNFRTNAVGMWEGTLETGIGYFGVQLFPTIATYLSTSQF